MASVPETPQEVFAKMLHSLANMVESGEATLEEILMDPEIVEGVPENGWKTHHLTGRNHLAVTFSSKNGITWPPSS